MQLASVPKLLTCSAAGYLLFTNAPLRREVDIALIRVRRSLFSQDNFGSTSGPNPNNESSSTA